MPLSKPDADAIPRALELAINDIRHATAATAERVADVKQSVTDLRDEVRKGYVTHDQFKPVAADVEKLNGLVSAAGKVVLTGLLGSALALLGLKGFKL